MPPAAVQTHMEPAVSFMVLFYLTWPSWEKTPQAPLWLRQPLEQNSCVVCITLVLCGDLVGPLRVGHPEEHWPACCSALWLPNSCLCVCWISLMPLRFRFILFTLIYSCTRWQLGKIATAFCLWIPLCCFSVFLALVIPSSWIKLQISSLPYSFSSLNH